MKKHLHKISKYTPSALQGTLQLEAERPRVGLAREFALERRLLSGLTVALMVLVAAYLYFVASSILNVIGQKDAEQSVRDIQGNVATLEEQYLALSQTLTMSAATGMGLAPVQSTSYVYRPGNAAMAPSERNVI